MIVSVLIPTYNSGSYIARAVRSVLEAASRVSEVEILVIDDGSKDDTLRILEPFTSQIKLLRHSTNCGLPSALNTGIRNARGQFIVRVDSDDFVHEQYINILTTALRLNNSYDAVCCDYFLVDEQQNAVKIVNSLEKPIGCGIMFRHHHLVDIGLYNETMRVCEEVELRERFMSKYQITRIPIPLYKYCKRADSLSSNSSLSSAYLEKLNNNR